MRYGFKFIIFVVVYSIGWIQSAFAQQIIRKAIVTTGNQNTLIDYTLGETFTTTMLNGNSMLTLGMQQADHLLTTSVQEIPNENLFEMDVFPNPTSDNFVIRLDSKINGKGTLKMVDCFGKIIFTQQIYLRYGSSELNVNTFNIPAGVYFACLQAGGYSCQLKVMKQ